MDDFYNKLKKHKENNSLTFNELGEMLNMSEDSFRLAMNKETFSDLRKEKLMTIIKNEQTRESHDTIFLIKEDVTISNDEIIDHLIKNIKAINENDSDKLNQLINAINTVRNIDEYNVLHKEINKIKSLLKRNKSVLN